MKIKTDPEGIFKEVELAKEYNDAIDLYTTVDQNEDFYIGDQWRGLQEQTPDLLLITVNFLQRACSMYISKVVSDDIAANITELKETEGGEERMHSIAREVDSVFELADLKKQNRQHVRNAVVDGDAAAHFWFDADAPTGEAAKGAIRAEIIENINVLFGNPYDQNVQDQPYMIVIQRVPLAEIRDEAEENGVKKDEIEAIRPDEDTNQGEKGTNNDLVTVAVKYYKDKKTRRVWMVKATENVLIRKAYDTGLTLYPIAWMPWMPVRKSYHGRSSISGLIPNQIALNSTYTSIMTAVRNTGFNKVIYSDLIGRWNPSPAAAIKVPGVVDVNKVATYLQGASVNPSVTNVMDSLLSLTRDCMGISDASAGDVKPDNYSAIVTLQNADNYPIELHRQEFHSFVEAQVRIIIDMMRAYYGTRTITVNDVNEIGETVKTQQDFDFGTLTDENVKIRVDIGASSYWSETMQVETLNNIFTSGIMNNPQLALVFLEAMPEKFIPRKAKLVEYLKQVLAQAGLEEPTATDQ